MKLAPLWLALRAAAAAGLVVTVGCTRAIKAAYSAATREPPVVQRSVREVGIVGTYLRPNDTQRHRGVIVLGGSDGGIRSAEYLGRRLADHGFVVLALAYFDLETLPPTLRDIPLEYFDTAVAWLQRQPNVEPHGIALVGGSRGAELALLIASDNRTVDRVVAYAPSHVVWGPVEKHPPRSSSAWTRAGQPLPFLTPIPQSPSPAPLYRGTPDFLAALQDTRSAAAAIPIERSAAAILLLSGDDDQLWPSTFMARQLASRLADHRHPYRVEHLSFPGAGHVLTPGFDPYVTEVKHPLGLTLALGGAPEANRLAQEKSWSSVLQFLRENDLHRSPK